MDFALWLTKVRLVTGEDETWTFQAYEFGGNGMKCLKFKICSWYLKLSVWREMGENRMKHMSETRIKTDTELHMDHNTSNCK